MDPWGMQASHFNYFANTKPVKEPVKTKYNQMTLPIPTQTRDCPGGSADGGAVAKPDKPSSISGMHIVGES